MSTVTRHMCEGSDRRTPGSSPRTRDRPAAHRPSVPAIDGARLPPSPLGAWLAVALAVALAAQGAVTIVTVAGAADQPHTHATPSSQTDHTGAQVQCNPYFPMPSGARWVFELTQSGGREVLRRVVSVKSSEQSDDVTMVQLEQTVGRPGAPASASAGNATTSVRCDAGDVTLTVTGSAAGPGGADQHGTGTVKAKTQGLPAAEKLVVGYAWRSESDIEANAEGKPVHSRATRGSKVEAIEPITVPAGTFPRALRVASVENLTVPGDDREIKQEVVEWYVRGLGLVKREGRVGAGAQPVKSTEQLVEYSGLSPDK